VPNLPTASPQVRPATSAPAAKILYIAGWGRSGTTIVDNILNSYDSVVSTGELVYVWQRGLIMDRPCGCGRPFSGCDFWQQVLRVAYGDRQPDPARVLALARESVRARHAPALLGGRLPAGAAEYAQIHARLYQAVAQVSRAGLIVDSSKTPSVAALLRRMSGVDPYVLHLVRDPRAVSHSWRRAAPGPDAPTPGTAAAGLHWLMRNALIERLGAGSPDRYQRLRYEDFTAQPRAAVERVLAFTGTPVNRGPFVDDSTVRLAVNHNVAGNAGRMRHGDVTLRRDDRWRNEQPRAARWASTAFALPLLHRYGYRARP
jgi:hypothetical protein